jgi:hypothetical protein
MLTRRMPTRLPPFSTRRYTYCQRHATSLYLSTPDCYCCYLPPPPLSDMLISLLTPLMPAAPPRAAPPRDVFALMPPRLPQPLPR